MSEAGPVRIAVNGEERDVPAGCTAAALLELLCVEPRTVAVAVAGVVVPRAQLAATRLGEGDAVEIVRAVGGG